MRWPWQRPDYDHIRAVEAWLADEEGQLREAEERLGKEDPLANLAEPTLPQPTAKPKETGWTPPQSARRLAEPPRKPARPSSGLGLLLLGPLKAFLVITAVLVLVAGPPAAARMAGTIGTGIGITLGQISVFGEAFRDGAEGRR